jgi:hypothetical protein
MWVYVVVSCEGCWRSLGESFRGRLSWLKSDLTSMIWSGEVVQTTGLDEEFRAAGLLAIRE